MRKLLGSALLLSGSFFFLNGFGTPKYSGVETQSSVKGKTAELEFKVTYDKTKIDISKEGNWTLYLTNTQGLKLDTKEGKFESKAFDEKLPGFKVKADLEGAATSGKVDFTLKAFVCKLDKTQCFPETHKGTLEWKKT